MPFRNKILKWPICGPKCSIFTIIMSVWGLIFLGLLGALFFIKYSLLFVDIGWEEDTGADFELDEVLTMFTGCAYNCWIAAGMYVLTGLFAFWQHKLNQRKSSSLLTNGAAAGGTYNTFQ